ncbi:MAG: polyphosphate kinase 2 family protein [Planctomycetota bacterium]|nr:MAG: polyphosphate kinase 2 family protein [Planctomycetota bacterium]
MKNPKLEDILDYCRVRPGKKFRLKDHDPGWEGDRSIAEERRREFAEQLLADNVAELAEAQEQLYASDTWSLLLVFQAMDAAGKDSTIKHVLSGVNPQGCHVTSFKQPSVEELDHDYLWRCSKALPERGRIGIFNRSYYEEVLVVRVHPEYLKFQQLPTFSTSDKIKKTFWQDRYAQINHFEEHLTRNGTAIVKFFLNVSKEEQRTRFLARLNEPDKLWKFSLGDLKERARWDDYMEAYQDCLEATSTEQAPWYVIPADNKWVMRAMVSRIIVQTIRSLNLKWPTVPESDRAELEAARRQLESE